jgi:hypothetical protein
MAGTTITVATVAVAAGGATTSGAMTDHVVRLYALSLAALVFLMSWAIVAARPWAASAEAKRDPRIVQLEKREARLARRQARVQRLVERRFAEYRRKLAERGRDQAALVDAPAAPSVQVTTLPAVTETSSS